MRTDMGEIRWDEVYLEMYRKQHCVDRKIHDFEWKCIQDAVNTEVRMMKYYQILMRKADYQGSGLDGQFLMCNISEMYT